jgi:hypothetical protein
MGLHVVHRQVPRSRIEHRFPGAVVLDVTSRGPQPWVRLSPFHPHGGIPVPLSPGVRSETVEGVWQGLKVFERADVDPAVMRITTMTGLKRTTRRYGAVLGHRAGLAGDRLLDYRTAREVIYLPTYRWVLEHRCADLVAELGRLAAAGPVVLLDFGTNGDVTDESRPLSYAALLAAHVRGTPVDRR